MILKLLGKIFLPRGYAHYVQSLAAMGDKEGQYWCGMMYVEGKHVPQDLEEAVKWFRKAAEQGHKDAPAKLDAIMPTVEMERKRELVANYVSAAGDDADAKFNIGLAYAEGKGAAQDIKLAKDWFRAAAELGHEEAVIHLEGLVLATAQNSAEVMEWYHEAAELGLALAQCNLGVRYQHGDGVEQDFEEAVKWYRRAAEQGHAAAQFHLGIMCAQGDGIAQDAKEAKKWFRKASDQGHAEAGLLLEAPIEDISSDDEEESEKQSRKADDQEDGDTSVQSLEKGIRKAAEQGDEEDESSFVEVDMDYPPPMEEFIRDGEDERTRAKHELLWDQALMEWQQRGKWTRGPYAEKKATQSEQQKPSSKASS